MNKEPHKTGANKRYLVKERLFAVVRSKDHQLNQIKNMSQGEIAFAVIKSNPAKMGQILDAGMDGLSFSYIANEKRLPPDGELDILFAEKDFLLSRLPFEPLDDTEMRESAPFSTHAMKRMRVQFGNLTVHQKRQIVHMLEHFTNGEVPDGLPNTSAG
jgi:hypothetical protein